MTSTILQELRNIEMTYKVEILYACESGSRAWGFPSVDSDYDVRFIYAHPRDWYLSISEKRDVIELPINDVLDINGWDLKKTLKQLKKSNSVVLEWLASPIVYRSNEAARTLLVNLAKKAFLPESSCHHYLSMAKRNITAYIHKQRVSVKAYFYSLRPMLCCKWIVEHLEQPPIRFEDLLNTFLPQGTLREEIEYLLKVKRQSYESDTVARSSELDKYLMTQLDELEAQIPKNPQKASIELFDNTFREILSKININFKVLPES